MCTVPVGLCRLAFMQKEKEKKKYTANISSAQRAKWAFYFDEKERKKEEEITTNTITPSLHTCIAFHWLHTINRTIFH